MENILLLMILVSVMSLGNVSSQSESFSESEVSESFAIISMQVELNETLQVASPNYPEDYPNGVTSLWLVSGPSNYQLMAIFKSFELEHGYDFLRIGSGLDPNDTSTILVKLTGTNRPDDLVSKNSGMWLEFTSDLSDTKQGFVIEITTVNLKNAIDVTESVTMNSLEKGESLSIISPNYPDDYPNKAKFVWLVSGPSNYQLITAFKSFELENNYDTLRIGSGLDPNNTSSILAILTGSYLPETVVSNTSEMWLEFTSDFSRTEQGFRLEITAVNLENAAAPGEVASFEIDESLTIISPNFPRNYPDRANSQWFVSGPVGHQIMAVFSNGFQLEGNWYDTLRIGSGLDPNDTSSILVTLTGFELPGVVVSNNSEMWLVFTSDASENHQGFATEIKIFTPGNFTDYALKYHRVPIVKESTNDDFTGMIMLTDSCHVEYCSDEATTLCRCDDMCRSFGDCCPDYTLSNDTLLRNGSRLNETVPDHSIWECVGDTFIPQFHPELGHGYRMITRCPFGWTLDDDVKRRCEDTPYVNRTEDVLYVQGDTYFRNLACVICNGLEASSLISIVIRKDEQCRWVHTGALECVIPQANTSYLNFSTNVNESISRVQNAPKPRVCLLNANESCPNGTDNLIVDGCRYLHKPFVNDGIVYKHPDCSLCQQGTRVVCLETADARGVMDEPIIAPIESIDVVGVFRIPEDIPEDRPALIISCIEGFELDDDGNCSPVSSDWPECQSTHVSVTQSNGTDECLEDMFCDRQVPTTGLPPPCLMHLITDLRNVTRSFILLYMGIAPPSLYTTRDYILQRALPHREQCTHSIVSVSSFCYIDSPGGCTEETFLGYYLDFMPTIVNNDTLIYTNGTYIRPTWWKNTTNIEFGNASISSDYEFMVCGTEVTLQTCSFITVSNDSIEWIDRDNQSFISFDGQNYDVEDFLVNPDGTVNICFVNQDTFSNRRVITILGHVLFAVSSVCLLATFITYVAFPTLRNRQGVSIMNFIVALFIGQILLQYVRLLVSRSPTQCLVVGALSHFFFLASFVWTTILAWDLSRSFAANNMKSFSSSSLGRKVVAFMIVGWGLPLLCVVITLVVQFGGFRIGPVLKYSRRFCWLGKLASITLFFVPMALCLLSNLVLFIITIHGVHSTKKSTSMLTQGQESQLKQWVIELRIYTKISTILGFAWLFGFLDMILKIPVTQYIFLIVISLQGLFILLSFGGNERVRKLWRTSLENSTIWTTWTSLSRREYSRGQTNSDTQTRQNSEKH